jgi:hypothetical protein
LAVFARRILQRCIDESPAYASGDVRRVWVRKLNSSSEPAYAATEWEIVLLHTIAKFGSLRHQPELPGGSSRIDILFDRSGLSFGADITTVSDRGLHERNPIRELESRLRFLYEAAQISTGGIALSVLDVSASGGRRTGRGTIVPPISEFDALVFNEAFFRWMSMLKERPTARSSHQVIYRNPLSLIRFTYVPGRIGAWCAEYSDYRVAKSVDRNPLYRSLASKAQQLTHGGFEGPLGIVVCDGGARALAQSFSGNVSTDEIVLEFLRRHTSVTFVIVLALRNAGSAAIRQRVEPRIYASEETPWHQELAKLFDQVVSALPQVLQTAENATNELRFWEGKKRFHMGGVSMTVGPAGIGELRMSTRTLLDVLSGRLSQKRLNEHYQFGNSGKSIFEHLVRTGRLLESARVERNPTEDDDEIVFKFGSRDPAASAFTNPDER